MTWKLLSAALLISCAANPTQKKAEPEAQSQPASQAVSIFQPNPYSSQTLEQPKGIAVDVELSSDGSKMVVLTDRGVKVFQAKEGKLLASFDTLPDAFDVDLSPDEKWLVVGSPKGAQVFRFSDFTLQQTIKKSNDVIRFSRDSYLTTAANGSLYIWDLSAKKQIATVEASAYKKKRDLNTGNISWLSNNTTTWSYRDDSSFWSLRDEHGAELLSDLHSTEDESVALSVKDPTTKKLLVKAPLGATQFFELHSSRWVISAREASSFTLSRFSASMSDCDMTLPAPRFCQTNLSQRLDFSLHDMEHLLQYAKLSPSGKYLITVNKEGEVKRWTTENFSLKSTGALLGEHKDVVEVEVSDNDQTLLTRDKNGAIKVWNLETGAFLYTSDGAKTIFEPNKI